MFRYLRRSLPTAVTTSKSKYAYRAKGSGSSSSNSSSTFGIAIASSPSGGSNVSQASQERTQKFDQPSTRRNWSEEEKTLARSLREQGMTFVKIAQQLGTTTAMARKIGHRSTVRKGARRFFFSPADDEKLRGLRAQRLTWLETLQHFPEVHTASTLTRRWDIISVGGQASPSIDTRHIRWTDAERHKLSHLKFDLRLSTREVAKHLPGRSLQAIRSQTTKLTPVPSRKQISPDYTDDERLTILRMRTANKSWKDISAALPGRSVIGLQNHWYRLRHTQNAAQHGLNPGRKEGQ